MDRAWPWVLGALCCASLLVALARSDSRRETSVTAKTPDELMDPAFLVGEALAWLNELEARHRPAGRALTAAERHAFAGYFAPELLDDARVTVVERLENPGFYQAFLAAGEPIPLDFRTASGFAVIDTVLIASSRQDPGAPSLVPLLFHELVHVAQNRVLGLETSTELYVAGWLEHRSYAAIPHEAQAFALTRRFAGGGAAFSVEEEVRRLFPAPPPTG